MASLDTLPPDQRAVLQLVLRRGRSYDEIAAMLSIDRAAVRERALTGLDALGPPTDVEAQRRALITDYLLGQLPAALGGQVRDRLAESAAERAWARVVAAELSPVAGGRLPEIPAEGGPPPEPEPYPEPQPEQAAGAGAARPSVPAEVADAPADRSASARSSLVGPDGEPPKSRLGGAILLGGGLLAVVVIVVVVLLAGSGGSSHTSSTQASASPTTASSATTPSASSSASSSAGATKPIAQINLTSPTGSKQMGGVGIVVKQGSSTGLVVQARGIPANTKHDAYAVWLYNSPSDNHILGFVNPPVSSNGVLQTEGVLPVNASHYKQLLVSLESQPKPTAPAQIILQGALSLS